MVARLAIVNAQNLLWRVMQPTPVFLAVGDSNVTPFLVQNERVGASNEEFTRFNYTVSML